MTTARFQTNCCMMMECYLTIEIILLTITPQSFIKTFNLKRRKDMGRVCLTALLNRKIFGMIQFLSTKVGVVHFAVHL